MGWAHSLINLSQSCNKPDISTALYIRTNVKMKIIETLAQCFFDVFYTGKFSGDPSFDMSGLSLDQAHRVQDSVTQKRIERGEAVVGYKAGRLIAAALASQIMGGPFNSLRW